MNVFTRIVRETTVHVIGRCPIKGCDAPRRRYSGPGVVKADRVRIWTEWKLPADDGWDLNPYAYVKYHGWTPERFETDQLFERVYVKAMRDQGWVCDIHHRFFKLVEVKGVYNADKTCNARCTNAIGPDCECSCAGAQHGAAHD